MARVQQAATAQSSLSCLLHSCLSQRLIELSYGALSCTRKASVIVRVCRAIPALNIYVISVAHYHNLCT